MSNEPADSGRNGPDLPAVMRNPWLFVPLLYFMQAIPVTIVQEVAAVFYKDLGIANEPIVRWTSLISLPWSLQLLLGPLVDLNGTKRRWILGGQFIIACGLVATAFLLRVPYAFEISLLVLGATAVTSALTNIATDGFYIISMPKESQAKFVGVQTTCYRLGRLFCTGLLLLFVGLLMRFDPLPVSAGPGATFAVEKNGQVQQLGQIALVVQQGVVSAKVGDEVVGKVLGVEREKPDKTKTRDIETPAGAFGLEASPTGELTALRVTGKETFGRLAVTRDGASYPAEDLEVGTSKPGMSPALAWPLILGAAAGIYLLGFLTNRITVPRPVEDKPAVPTETNETQKNILRTFVLLAIGIGGYFTMNALVRLTAHALHGSNLFGMDLAGWKLPDENKIIGFDLGFGPVGTEIAQLVVCALIVAGAFVAAKRLIVGTPMGEAFSSFFRQQGIVPIFFFILFYRFGEAMVSKMSPLFLKDSLANGGLAVPNEQLGLIKGVAGVVGIILGGLAGGWVVSRIGLKKALWPLAIMMHIPNLLYLWASIAKPAIPALFVVDFVDQFGYGFGFAAYMVYLMWVAQRGNFKTSHYAIGTGMGALCIAIAGIVSGIVQKNFGYHGFFVWVIFLTIPGMLTLLFIPLDESHGKKPAPTGS